MIAKEDGKYVVRTGHNGAKVAGVCKTEAEAKALEDKVTARELAAQGAKHETKAVPVEPEKSAKVPEPPHAEAHEDKPKHEAKEEPHKKSHR